MKLLLTDGRDEVMAVENEPLWAIELQKTLPGTKIRVFGPIEVRRGLWLLRESNLELMWHNTEDKEMVQGKTFAQVKQKVFGVENDNVKVKLEEL